jgi:hypothetical protein
MQTQTPRWRVLARPPPNRRPYGEEEKQQHKELTNFCSALVDRHEDEIIEALQNDDFGTEQGEWGCALSLSSGRVTLLRLWRGKVDGVTGAAERA